MNWEAQDLDREFRRFKQHCSFVFNGPLEQKTEIVKCNYLMSFIGDKGRDIYSTFQWAPATPAVAAVVNANGEEVTPAVAAAPAENETLNGVYAKFENYVAPKKNQIRATVIFNRRKQKDSERFDDFVTDLRRLIQDCGYGDQEDRMLRDAIVLRAYHAKVREKCLDKGDDLTLQMAITYGQSYEASSQSMKMIEDKKLTDDLNKLFFDDTRKPKKGSGGKPNSNDNGQGDSQSSDKDKLSKKKRIRPPACKHCARNHKGECRFKNMTCHRCQQVGHITPACTVNFLEQEDEGRNEDDEEES